MRWIVLGLFFVSGIAGLVYQIVWTRMLVLVFGNTLLATSTVLSSFMAGLAAGSFFLGEYIDRKPRRLLKLYAGLEAGIGLFALVFPLLLAAVTPLYTALYQSFDENLPVVNLARFAVCFLLILLPTFCMGGTLPVLLKHFAGDLRRIGYQVGFLYGLNTAGAVVGCVASGYLLLGVAGLRKTMWIAVALNFTVALVAWFLPDRRAAADLGSARTAFPDAGESAEGRYRRPIVVAVLTAIGVSGFCALAYEVLWVRMLNLFLNNNMHSFTATIATFLTGIAIGSLIYTSTLSRVRAKLTLFALLQAGIAVMALAIPFVFRLLQQALFADKADAMTLIKTAVIMVGPTVLMGIAVPLAVQICQWGEGREGRSVGAVYAFNTVGSILGAFVAGFVLIPTIGLHAGLMLVASLNLGAGFLALASRAGATRRAGFAAAWGATVAAIFLTAPDALFRDLYQRSAPRSEILHYKEGKVVNVVVYDFEAGYQDLHLNGIEEASTRLWHVQLFKLLGVLPPMMHDDPDQALMIAFGAGMSAGAAIQRVKALEVVDLNPDIHGPAELFRRENLDVINSPKLTLTANDGRNELLLDPTRYSVIISDATNPKMFDSWTLYTREFYELTRERLLPGGVFAQWLVYPLPADSLSLILRTFRTVYPHASLWCIHGSTQCLMLGTQERLSIDYEEFDRKLAPVLAESRFVDYGVSTTPKFLSFLLLGEDELGEFLGDSTKISTDDLPYAQFEVGRTKEGVQECLDILKHQNTIAPYLNNLGPHSEEILGSLEAHRAISQRLNLGFFLNDRNEYLKAAHLAARAGLPDDANVASALRYDDGRKEHHLRWVAAHPDEAGAYNSLGYVYWHQGDHDRAIDYLLKAVELAPDFGNAHANLARVYLAAGMPERAVAKLVELRRLHPSSANLHLADHGVKAAHLLLRLRYETPTVGHYRALASAYLGIGDLLAAIDAIGTAEDLAGNDAEALAELAAFYARLELVDDSARLYRRAAEAGPMSAGLGENLARAEALGEDPRRKQAWLHERKSAVLQAETAASHPLTCTTAMNVWGGHGFTESVDRERLGRAARLFEESYETDPGHLHAYLDAAMLHELAGDPGRALGVWRQLSTIDGAPPQTRQELRRLELVSQLQWQKLAGEAKTQALGELGALYEASGRVPEAIESYEGALRINPGNTEIRFRLGAVYAAAGRYPDALSALEQASSGNSRADLRGAIRDGLERVRAIVGAVPSEP